MQRSIGALVLFLTFLSCGGSPGFSGSYDADYMGQSVALRLEESDGNLRGELSYSGLTGAVSGSVSGGVAEGQVSAGLMGDLPFEARLEGDSGLRWKYLLPLPGEAQALDLHFVRSEEDQVAHSQSNQVDPRLVGRWRRTISHSVGGMLPRDNLNVATDIYCSLSGDGSFSFGGAVTGAASTGMAGTTGAGAVDTGRWKTEGDVLYSQAKGQSDWVPLGRYSISGASMVLHVGPDKQLWERQ